jgi:hypothetical protein
VSTSVQAGTDPADGARARWHIRFFFCVGISYVCVGPQGRVGLWHISLRADLVTKDQGLEGIKGLRGNILDTEMERT